jgi:hypothetical protein
MDSKEFELRYKRMWSEYTDEIMSASDQCEDRDFAAMALIEEAKNAHNHIMQCGKKICELCPELDAHTVIDIITNNIPFLRIQK